MKFIEQYEVQDQSSAIAVEKNANMLCDISKFAKNWFVDKIRYVAVQFIKIAG